jgi:predicted amidohydrolase
MNTLVNALELKIASIQMVSTPNLNENLELAASLIKSASDSGSKLVVLPEYFCLMGLKDTDKVKVREAVGSGPIQERLSAIAQENNIYLVAGSIPLETQESNKVLNSSLVFNPMGERIARYDKIHLFGFQTEKERYEESETIAPGSQPGQFQITVNEIDWRFGLSICYDLRFPELYRALGEVDCHIIPAAFTYTTGKDHWEILLRARAIENQCYVLSSAQGGVHINQRRTWGDSMLIDPWGQILTNLPQGEGLITGTLSKDKLNEVRSKLPALKHRRL